MLKAYKIERLRYKCLITVMALLEKLEDESVILEKMRKTLKVTTLKENLIIIYKRYEEVYGGKYIDDAFGWFDKQSEEKYSHESEKKKGCIIENGFYIYLLVKVMIDSIKPEEEERYIKLIMLKNEIEICDKIAKKDQRQNTGASGDRSEQHTKLLVKKALRFYKTKIIQIDIIRDDMLEKVYFPKMPYCFNLPKKVALVHIG